MDLTKFQDTAQSAMNERERWNLFLVAISVDAHAEAILRWTMVQGATMSEMTYFLDEVVVTPSHAVAAEPDFEICD